MSDKTLIKAENKRYNFIDNSVSIFNEQNNFYNLLIRFTNLEQGECLCSYDKNLKAKQSVFYNLDEISSYLSKEENLFKKIASTVCKTTIDAKKDMEFVFYTKYNHCRYCVNETKVKGTIHYCLRMNVSA